MYFQNMVSPIILQCGFLASQMPSMFWCADDCWNKTSTSLNVVRIMCNCSTCKRLLKIMLFCNHELLQLVIWNILPFILNHVGFSKCLLQPTKHKHHDGGPKVDTEMLKISLQPKHHHGGPKPVAESRNITLEAHKLLRRGGLVG